MIGETRRQDRAGIAGEGLSLAPVVALAQAEFVIAIDAAGEDPAAAPIERPVGIAGVLERMPALHQEQPLLRIHEVGIAGREIEEIGIESGRVAQEAAPFAVASRRRPAVLAEEPLQGPA